jgi:hypothetical protein
VNNFHRVASFGNFHTVLGSNYDGAAESNELGEAKQLMTGTSWVGQVMPKHGVDGSATCTMTMALKVKMDSLVVFHESIPSNDYDLVD